METSSQIGKGLADSAGSPSVFCSVRQPCGHTVALEDAWISKDHYECPLCGVRWHVDQEPPTIYPSGFVMPGKRSVVVEKQSNLPMRLPHPDDVAARKALAARKPVSVAQVMAQAEASRKYRLANDQVRHSPDERK